MNKPNPSRNLAARPRAAWACRGAASTRSRILFLLAGLLAIRATQAAGLAATNTPAAIPWNQIGAKAGADYQGDGLAVTPTESGARLHCVFQRLDGEATPEGLWLASTVTNTVNDPSSVAALRRVDRFRVTAMAVGRVGERGASERQSVEPSLQAPRSDALTLSRSHALPDTGTVTIDGQTVRLSRPGLTEEYSVSMDGVRQDFIVEQAPPSPPGGELVVKLAVSGAEVQPAADGARLVLTRSGRKIAYSRLRVTDATGKELTARMEVASGILPDVEGAHPAAWNSGADCSWAALRNTPESAGLEAPALRQAGMPAATSLAVVVNDTDAVYPVRIDPTFSDANWVSMGGLPGANGQVNAAVTDGSGNLYIGGLFSAVGNIVANNVAQWNGSSWSALGSGISGTGSDGGGPYVGALAVSGSTLYAGGNFTSAGGSAANSIAQWNGSSWSAIGWGIGDVYSWVYALAVSGSTLYAGGFFQTAGGNAAYSIAQWNGSSWSPLGLGIGGGASPYVSALAVSGSTLYAGGDFTNAGGSAANYIAQLNGSSWSALGSGISGTGSDGGGPYVRALAVSGSTLYAGGSFTTAGGSAANYIAQWNGSSWSALGSGISGGSYTHVSALAVSGSTLYAGGEFTTAGGSAANSIAQWNGRSWSALGSGVSGGEYGPSVDALAVSGGTLYAGGYFTNAGGSAANNIAQWNGSSWSPLGSGLSGPVAALAVSGSTLYAGGEFTSAGGIAATNIAQWNGSSWSALGSGMNEYGYVNALAVSGSTLYAGGYFTTAGGIAANYIAQWNGSSWSALGSGMNGAVSALAVSGSTLYAGGNFTTAGGKVSAYAAEAYLVAPPGGLVDSIVLPSSGIADVRCYGNPGQQFGVQRTTNLAPPLWTNVNSSPLIPAADGSFTFADTNAPPGAAFYRAFQY